MPPNDVATAVDETKPALQPNSTNNGHLNEDVKHASDIIGNWGPVQTKVFFFFILLYIVAPFQNLSMVFYAPKLNFYCHDPVNNVSLNNTCYYQVDNSSIPCTHFTYDMDIYDRVLTSEFDLVCDRSWLASMTQTIHQIGYAIAGVAFGLISDRYGRVFSEKIAVSLEVVMGLVQAFSPNMTVYMISRLFFGIASYGRFLNFYVLIMEWVGPKLRGTAAIALEFGYSTGYILVPIVFRLIPDYVVIHTSVAIFEVLMLSLLFIPNFIPESPRWLLTHYQFKEAHDTLSRAAKMKNNLRQEVVDSKFISLKENTMKELEETKNSKKSTIIDVWKIPRLRSLSCILYFSWFSLAFIYYGSVFNMGNFGGNIFINFVISGFSYTFSNMLLLFLMNRFGRRPLLIFMTFLDAFAFLGMFATSFSDAWYPARLAFAFLGIIGVSCGFNLIYIYTAETFPTTMRQVSIGTCSVFARIGSGIAPFMKELTNVSHLSVAMAIFGFLALINAILVLHVPETKGKQLPDTLLQTAANCEEKGSPQEKIDLKARQ